MRGVRRQKSEDRRQKTEVRSQESGDERQAHRGEIRIRLRTGLIGRRAPIFRFCGDSGLCGLGRLGVEWVDVEQGNAG